MQPGRQGVEGFDPRSVPGLQVWLDAADSNTVTVTSGFVSSWRDKSSNGYTFSNAATTGRTGPTRVTTLNGLDVLTFTAANATDAAGQFLDNTVASLHNLSAHVMCLVHRPSVTNGVSYGDTNLIVAVSNTTGVQFPFASAAGTLGYSNSFYTRQFAINDVSTAYNISVASRTYDSTTLYRNGRLQTYWPAGTDVSTVFSATLRVGAAPGATPSNFYSGTVAELLVYSNAISSEVRRAVEGYLAWKWGLQTTLPPSCSYSVNPPISRPFLPIDLPKCIIWFDAADTRTLVTSGTQVTRWINKGILDTSAGGPVVGTASTGFTFNTSSLNTVQFPGGAYLTVSNVVTTTPHRTQFFIFTVTSFGDGYSRIFSSSVTTSNQQVGFNAWNRDTNTLNMFPATLSATEYVGTIGAGSAPYSGTLPYNATPFIIGIRHTGGRSSNAITIANAISVNGVRATLNVDRPLSNGYFVGTGVFWLGTGPGYTNVQRIGEVIQYDRALPDDEMREVEGYLGWKWNVPMPIGHPFYQIPPSTPATFLPSFFPSCMLWLDAADTTTLTTVGSAVTAWADKSGRNHTVTFGAQRPTTGTVRQNGNNALVFSSARGSNIQLGLAVGYHTLFAVHNPTSTTANRNLFRFQGSTGGISFPTSTTIGWSASDGGGNSGGTASDGSPPGVYSLIVASISRFGPDDEGNNEFEVFRNGRRVANSSTSSFNVDVCGGFLNVGATSTNTDYYDGTVCELIAYSGRLCNSGRRLVEGYLAKKWGL